MGEAAPNKGGTLNGFSPVSSAPVFWKSRKRFAGNLKGSSLFLQLFFCLVAQLIEFEGSVCDCVKNLCFCSCF